MKRCQQQIGWTNYRPQRPVRPVHCDKPADVHSVTRTGTERDWCNPHWEEYLNDTAGAFGISLASWAAAFTVTRYARGDA